MEQQNLEFQGMIASNFLSVTYGKKTTGRSFSNGLTRVDTKGYLSPTSCQQSCSAGNINVGTSTQLKDVRIILILTLENTSPETDLALRILAVLPKESE